MMIFVYLALGCLGLYLLYLFIVYKIRSSNDFDKSMNLTFLRLSFPIKDSKDDKEKDAEMAGSQSTYKEVLNVMTHLFESVHSIYSGNFIDKYIGEKFFSMEMAVIDKELNYYIVIPMKLKIMFEKQISSFYPDVFITEEPGYSIYSEGCFIATKVLALSKENYQPIRTYDRMGSDPVNTIINLMSKMEEKEGAMFQVVLRPAGDGWQKMGRDKAKQILEGKKGKDPFWYWFNPFYYLGMLFNMILSGDGPPKEKESAGRTTQMTEELVKVMEEKNTHVGFECVVRIIASGPTQKQADILRDVMASAFKQYAEPDINSFVPIVYSPYLANYHALLRVLDIPWYAYKGKKWWKIFNKPFVLTPKEITSIIHFPNIKYNKSVVIKWQQFKIAPAPSNLPDEGMLLGINSYRGTEKKIRIRPNDRMRHFYLIGKSGTGKSTLLETMIKQDLASGNGLCLIDPHGDLVEGVLPYVPRHRADDVIIFDPGDLERPMGLNMLEAYSEDEKEYVSQETLAIFIKLYGEEIMGPRLQHYFRNGVLTLLADNKEGASIIDIMRLFTDDAYMEAKVAKVTNPEVRSFWEREMAKSGQREKEEIIPYFAAKFGPFKTNAVIRNIIGQVKSGFNFRHVMDEGKILLCNLSKGKLGDLNSKLVGMIMVAKIQMAAMSRVDTPEKDRRDFYLYVDEFQNFVTDSFASILSEARKYRLGLIIAHQYISQITKLEVGGKGKSEDTTIRDAVFGNVGSMMCFKIGASDAETMAKEFQPVFSEQDLINIANHNAYIKLNINNSTSRGFSMKTIHDITGADMEAAKAYKQLSRLKYARDRRFVEQEITRRINA